MFCLRDFSVVAKEKRCKVRRHHIRQYLFLKQNSLYLCQKPRKATALLHFRLRYKNFSVLTKLRSTLNCEIIVQEKAKTTDNADAYRWFLTHYCAVSSHFKEILPYGVSAFSHLNNCLCHCLFKLSSDSLDEFFCGKCNSFAALPKTNKVLCHSAAFDYVK